MQASYRGVQKKLGLRVVEVVKFYHRIANGIGTYLTDIEFPLFVVNTLLIDMEWPLLVDTFVAQLGNKVF